MRIVFTSFLLLVLLLSGCRLIRMSSAEKVKTYENCERMMLENNRVMIPVKIEGKNRQLLLDMGASGSVIFDTSVIPNYYSRTKAFFGKAKGADRKKMKLARVPLQLSNGLHTSQNKVFVVLPRSPINQADNCSVAPITTGLYGYDLMQLSEVGYLLDFDSGQMCNIKSGQMDEVLSQGYQQAKAKISDRHITIYILIDGIEYPFKFDTGFTGSFTMPFKEGILFSKDEHVSMEGIQAKTVAGFASSEDDYYQKEVSFGGQNYATNITVSRSIKAQNVGMGFIKAFNWVVDTKNKKLFIRKNGHEQDTKIRFTHPYYAQVDGGKLLVRLRRIGSNDFGIGDEITSVNGQPVDAKNRCALLKKLNEEEDWKVLKVVVKKR